MKRSWCIQIYDKEFRHWVNRDGKGFPGSTQYPYTTIRKARAELRASRRECPDCLWRAIRTEETIVYKL